MKPPVSIAQLCCNMYSTYRDIPSHVGEVQHLPTIAQWACELTKQCTVTTRSPQAQDLIRKNTTVVLFFRLGYQALFPENELRNAFW